MGQHLSPRYGQVILVSGYPVLTAVNWSQHGCATSGCTWASKLVRKCEIKYWFPYGAFGRSVTVTWLPNFLGRIDLLSHGAPPTCAWSSAIKAHLITLPGEKSGTMLLKDLKREFCRIKDNQVLCQLIVKIKIEGKADRTAKVYKFIYPISRLDKTSLHQGLGKLSENRINSYSI